MIFLWPQVVKDKELMFKAKKNSKLRISMKTKKDVRISKDAYIVQRSIKNKFYCKALILLLARLRFPSSRPKSIFLLYDSWN